MAILLFKSGWRATTGEPCFVAILVLHATWGLLLGIN
jgi:hypothetical protein